MTKPCHDRTKGLTRILLISTASPFRQQGGSEQRSHLLYRALSRIGLVDVLWLTEGKPAHTPERRFDLEDVAGQRIVTAQLAPIWLPKSRFRPKAELTKAIESFLGLPLSTYDLIVSRYLWPLCQLALPANMRTLVDLDDLQFHFSSEIAWYPSTVLERFKKNLGQRMACKQLFRFDAGYLVCEQDRQLVGGMPVCTLPNVPLLGPSAPHQYADNTARLPSVISPQVLFVGSLWYGPNYQGAAWFARHVWPTVIQAIPAAQLILAGPASEIRRRALETHPSISAPGFVEDLAGAYRAASAVVVPVLAGGGSSIKLLEGLAHGRPCVASELTARAYAPHLRPDEHLLTAASPEQFSHHVIALLRSPDRYIEMAERGRIAVSEHFTVDRFLDIAEGFARNLLCSEIIPTNSPHGILE